MPVVSGTTSSGNTSSGTCEVTVSFTNTETDPSLGMNVIAQDQKSGAEVNLGSVAAGQTKTGVIQLNTATITGGTVLFLLTWSNGSSGSDVHSATYGLPTAMVNPKPTYVCLAANCPKITP
jgi:hypothetical protein